MMKSMWKKKRNEKGAGGRKRKDPMMIKRSRRMDSDSGFGRRSLD